jgi:hypothetical protein
MRKPARRELVVAAWMVGLWVIGVTGGLFVIAAVSGHWKPLEIAGIALPMVTMASVVALALVRNEPR